MSDNQNVSDKKENKTVFLIIIIILLAAIVALGAYILIILTEDERKPAEPSAPSDYMGADGKLNYDQAAIAIDEEQLQKEVDELFQKVEDGYVSLSHKNLAISNDGVNFECYVANNIDNKYDIYLNIYKDYSAQEQLLLTGLIPPGSGIDHFTSEIKLDPGQYKALLVITQVEEDHATLHGDQLFLALDLVVS